jgi:hypothetical protein
MIKMHMMLEMCQSIFGTGELVQPRKDRPLGDGGRLVRLVRLGTVGPCHGMELMGAGG